MRSADGWSQESVVPARAVRHLRDSRDAVDRGVRDRPVGRKHDPQDHRGADRHTAGAITLIAAGDRYGIRFTVSTRWRQLVRFAVAARHLHRFRRAAGRLAGLHRPHADQVFAVFGLVAHTRQWRHRHRNCHEGSQQKLPGPVRGAGHHLLIIGHLEPNHRDC
jgi:hypothetical protein